MIAQVMFPAMSTLQDDDERLRRAYIRTSLLIALFTFPAMLGLFVTADPFVRLVLGAKWLPVIGLLMVFAPLGAAQSVATISGLIYYVKGRTDWMFRWGCFSGALFVISFLLGLRWGIQGVAACYAIMWSLLALPGLAIPLSLIHLPLAHYLRQFWQVLKPSLVMAVVAAAWLHGLRGLGVWQPVLLLLSTSAVGAACYTGLMFWWKPPVLTDLRTLLEHSGNPLAQKAARCLPANSAEQAGTPAGIRT
jgi:PST family polysaccharide transporter